MHLSRPNHATSPQAEAGPLQAMRAAALGSALAALQAGRLAAAEAQAGSWAQRDPQDIEAMLLHGLAIAAQGHAMRAAPLLLKVAAARPGFAHPCHELGKLRPDAPSLVAAQFRACRALASTDTRLSYAYADFLLDAGNPAAAAAVLRMLIEDAPGFAPARNLFGMALVELGDMAGAIAAFREALALNGAEGAVWANLGMTLKIEGRFGEALEAHDAALARAPDDARLRLNRAITLLRAGRLAEAWPDYEARLAAYKGRTLPMQTLLPAVEGLDLAGRTVLAWHEEGFGDTLQFGRYLPMLAARGARVLLRAPAELARLFASMPGIEIVDAAAPLPAFDWHVPVFSLPRAFRTTLENIPADIPYLRADPAAVGAWAERLGTVLPGRALRVGIVWAGQARPWATWFTTLDSRRSTVLTTFAPLAEVPGITLVSLQKGPPARELRAAPRGMRVHDPMPEAADFADTAAIVENLDVVVSVDTSVVHLAGALGKPVLLLDRYDSCWRWLADREDSPWYPALRIVRQPRPGDWDHVIARAAAILGEMARRAG
jgi:tetratricopeptide (TPR) repeat protein